MKRYWVAHARGPNFDYLKKIGFVHFYPTMDDYVFLEVTDTNKKYLRKQTELCVSFMKMSDEFVTISEAELREMGHQTTDQIAPGSEIKVLIGYCENLDGVVNAIEGDKLQVTLQGYNRKYEASLNVDQIVLRTPETENLRIGEEVDPTLNL